jgi:hypothetical protein
LGPEPAEQELVVEEGRGVTSKKSGGKNP